MKCANCGLDLLEGALQCPRCLAEVAPAIEVVAQPGDSSAQPSEKATALAGWVRKRGPLVAGVLVGLVAIAWLVASLPRLLAPNVEDLQQQGDVAGLVEALRYEGYAETRVHAANALGALAPPEALSPLLAAQADETVEVQQAARVATWQVLSRQENPDAFAALLAVFAQDGETRVPAARTLKELETRIGPQHTVAALFMAQVAHPEVSAAAGAKAETILVGMGDKDAFITLTALMEDPSEAVAGMAKEVVTQRLASWGPNRAANAVLAAGGTDAWLALALQVPEDQLSVETWRRGLRLETEASIKQAAAGVRDGTPAAAAHPYQPSDAFHPVVVLPDTPGFSWTGVPTALRFLELVAVVTTDQTKVEVCRYSRTGGATATVTRYRNTTTVKVLAANTGAVVEKKTFSGGTPARCQATIYTYDGAALTIEGSDPTGMDAWLADLVNAS